jgi:pimeloyl-ACP methyl ester carboxylesterase
MSRIERCNGISVRYDSTGSGPALVFLHAYPTNRTIWRAQMTALSERWRTVAYDLRGFGETDAPHDPKQYGTDKSVGDLLGLLDALGIGRASLCGLSMGGNIALHFALRHPDRVSALILVDTGAGSEDPGEFARTTHAWADVAEGQGIGGFADFVLANPIFAEYADRGAQERKYLREVIAANPAHGVAHTARRVLAPRPPIYALESQLEKLEVPVLIVVGEEDPACIPVGRYMNGTIPGAALALVPGAGHFNNLELPDLFNRTCRTFLSGLDGH